MLFTLFSPKFDSISSLCNTILNSRIDAYRCYFILKRNPDWISNNYCGKVEEMYFLRLIDSSVDDKLLQTILVSILDSVDAECITDFVFRKLIEYPESIIRQRLIVSLCHKKLSEKQLRLLCNIGTEFECFFELSIIYYTESNYSLEYFKDFLESFKKCSFGYMYTELLTETLDFNKASSEAKKVLILNELSKV